MTRVEKKLKWTDDKFKRRIGGNLKKQISSSTSRFPLSWECRDFLCQMNNINTWMP